MQPAEILDHTLKAMHADTRMTRTKTNFPCVKVFAERLAAYVTEMVPSDSGHDGESLLSVCLDRGLSAAEKHEGGQQTQEELVDIYRAMLEPVPDFMTWNVVDENTNESWDPMQGPLTDWRSGRP